MTAVSDMFKSYDYDDDDTTSSDFYNTSYADYRAVPPPRDFSESVADAVKKDNARLADHLRVEKTKREAFGKMIMKKAGKPVVKGTSVLRH